METAPKARMRNQILAGENDINTLSGFAAAGRLQMPDTLPPQHPMYQNGSYASPNNSFSNHDLLTPVNVPGAYVPGSRKASMVSQLSMQRLFRRKDISNFDDDAGADLGDDAVDLSFSDIAHLRGAGGRYNVTGGAVDTMPIIPVLGVGGFAPNSKNLTPLQYRKLMNHQKKLNLTHSARAMSLAGSNPNGMAASVQDNRAMSFGQAPRTKSLNSNVILTSNGGQMYRGAPGGPPMGPGGPRMGPAMGNGSMGNPSMGNFNMGNPNMGNPGPNGPRAMSMRAGNPYPQGYGPSPGAGPGARTNSLSSNVMLGRPTPQGYVPMGARAQSLTQGSSVPQNMAQRPVNQQNGQHPQNGQFSQNGQFQQNGQFSQNQYGQQRQHGQFGPNGQPLFQNPGGQSNLGSQNTSPNQNGHQFALVPYKQLRQLQRPTGPAGATHSNDSLMNLVVEEEDYTVTKLDPGVILPEREATTKASLPLAETTVDDIDDEDRDIIYKFDEDHSSPLVSRKSTVKKSNSMRVRRLDLFKNNGIHSSPEEVEIPRATSPSFNLDKIGDRFSKKLAPELSDDEVAQHQLDLAKKLQALGASATMKEKDVFTTAPEFHSPLKLLPKIPTDDAEQDILAQGTPAWGSTESETKSIDSQSSLSQPKKRTIKFKSLVANTAFSNFRSPSQASQGTFILEAGSTESFDFEPPAIDKQVDDAESKSSIYCSDSPNLSNGADLLQSPLSEQRSSTEFVKFKQADINDSLQTSEVTEQLDPYEESTAPIAVHEIRPETFLDDLPSPTVDKAAKEVISQVVIPKQEGTKEAEIQDNVATSSNQSLSASSATRVSHEDARDMKYEFNNHTDAENLQRFIQGQTDAKTDQRTPQMPYDEIAVSKRVSRLSKTSSDMSVPKLLSSGFVKGAETSDTFNIPVADTESSLSNDMKKERRKSRNSSISSKSKSFIKRLSKSSSKKNVAEEWGDDEPATPSIGTNQRMTSRNRNEILEQPKRAPLSFSKEQLAIMTCNNDLQNELQLVTSELALSIKRELALETQSKTRNGYHDKDLVPDINILRDDLFQKSQMVAQLQEKLNNERRLRFISEEHAILSEHGQTPSALKLDYEKNEIYKQLLAKNDMVNQLQDKLEEVQSSRHQSYDDDLLDRYNELLKENSELKSSMEKMKKQNRKLTASFTSENVGAEESSDGGRNYLDTEYEQAQIMSLRTQRDELREMLTKLTSSQNMELKIAQDRVRTLETKLEKVNVINDKLSRRLDPKRSDASTTGVNGAFLSGKGGKLQGFSIVSPKTFFED